jgi:hypothetical protein
LASTESDALLMFLLKQRDPQRFNQKMIEVQVGGSGTPISVEHTAAVIDANTVHILLPDNGRDIGNAHIVRELASKFAHMAPMIEGTIAKDVDGGCDNCQVDLTGPPGISNRAVSDNCQVETASLPGNSEEKADDAEADAA